MVKTSHAQQAIPYLALVAIRRISGAAVIVLSLLLAMWAHDVPMSDSYQALIIISALMGLMFSPGSRRNIDVLPSRMSNASLSVLARWILIVATLLLFGYATKTSSIFSRLALFTWFILTPPLLIMVQVGIEVLASRMLHSASAMRSVVIAGVTDHGCKLASKIRKSPLLNMNVEGFFDDRGKNRLSRPESVNVLGQLKQLPDYVRKHRTDVIFIVLPIRNIQRVTELLDQLHDTTASIYFVPDVFVFDLIQCRTTEIDGMPVVALCETPFQGVPGMIKMVSDYAIASIVLLLTAPLMILIAITIKLTSPGSVIFKQRRYGLDGQEIVVYKFRTMTVSEDSGEIRQATRNDKRITRVGAFLRKYSLDELPQFINVLQGRMSVVGPRPHAIAHNEQYRPLIKGYMIRHKVNPGITGLAQILGYRGETDTVDVMRDRIKYDLEYLRNWSLSLDLRIIIKTLRIILTDRMAF